MHIRRPLYKHTLRQIRTANKLFWWHHSSGQVGCEFIDDKAHILCEEAMKRLTATIAITVWLSSLLTACAGLGSNADVGKEEYESKCATCHGVSGKGDGPQGQILPTQPADLTLLAKRNGGVFPTQRVHGIIDGRLEVNAHGPRTMPVWGRFFQVDVPDLPDEASGTIDFRESTVSNKIQLLIEYLSRLQDTE